MLKLLRNVCNVIISYGSALNPLLFTMYPRNFASDVRKVQQISPSVAMIPFIPFTRVSERVIHSLTSSGMREMGVMQVEHPESNIAVSIKVIPLILNLVLMNVEERCWILST